MSNIVQFHGDICSKVQNGPRNRNLIQKMVLCTVLPVEQAPKISQRKETLFCKFKKRGHNGFNIYKLRIPFTFVEKKKSVMNGTTVGMPTCGNGNYKSC